MNYVIGVDGGATKTSACGFSLDGRLLVRYETGPGNFVEDPGNAERNLLGAVKKCLENLGNGCLLIGAGAAGMRSSGLAGEIREKLERAGNCQARVTDDGMLALYANLGQQEGILVIAGTGSIVYGRSKTGQVSVGGWGYLLDDRGSGTAIALNCLRYMVRSQDEGCPVSLMGRDILKELGCGDIWQLPQAVSRRGKARIAGLAPIVAEHAKKGDKIACHILTQAGGELADMACQASGRLGLTAPLTGVSGSVFEKNPLVTQAFWEKMKACLPDAVPCQTHQRAEKGALWFYQEMRHT